MITKVKMGSDDVLSIGLPFMQTIQDLQYLRSGFMEIAEEIMSCEDFKDNITAISLWFLLQLVDTLNKDIETLIEEREREKKEASAAKPAREALKRKKGGEVCSTE